MIIIASNYFILVDPLRHDIDVAVLFFYSKHEINGKKVPELISKNEISSI